MKTKAKIKPFISFASGNHNLNLSGVISITNGMIYGVSASPGVSAVHGNVYGINFGGLCGAVNGGAIGNPEHGVHGVNSGLGFAFSLGNIYGASLGGLMSLNHLGKVHGVSASAGITYADSIDGVSLGGVFSLAKNARGVSAGILGEITESFKDYKVKDIIPKFTRYLPRFIQEIDIPSLHFGIVTRTGNVKNSAVFGIVNYIEQQRDEDYISFGFWNVVKKSNGEYSRLPLCNARVRLDGILSHKKLEERVEGGGNYSTGSCGKCAFILERFLISTL